MGGGGVLASRGAKKRVTTERVVEDQTGAYGVQYCAIGTFRILPPKAGVFNGSWGPVAGLPSTQRSQHSGRGPTGWCECGLATCEWACGVRTRVGDGVGVWGVFVDPTPPCFPGHLNFAVCKADRCD